MDEQQSIYLMTQTNGLTKIGISNNPQKRARGIASQSGVDVTLIWSTPVGDARAAEAKLHLDFKSKRVKGEWFQLDQDDIKKIKSFDYSGFKAIPRSPAAKIEELAKLIDPPKKEDGFLVRKCRLLPPDISDAADTLYWSFNRENRRWDEHNLDCLFERITSKPFIWLRAALALWAMAPPENQQRWKYVHGRIREIVRKHSPQPKKPWYDQVKMVNGEDWWMWP